MRLLDAKGVSKRFGGVQALRAVDVHQDEWETLGMIGPNGSGKTTFVNAITGHLPIDGGSVRFAGKEVAGLKPHRLAGNGLTRTYQAVRIFGKLSVRDNIATASLLTGVEPAKTGELLDWLKLGNRLDDDAGSLTLFEQRRLELLMRLISEPKLIMLDEPVGGLAAAEVREMIAVLTQLKARCSIFVIEHTMRVIRELADRVVVLMAGEKMADGPPADILKDKRVIENYLGTAHA